MTDKVRLPVVSSASSTAFCAAKLEGPGGYLWIDGNSKITTTNGTYADPKPNAFSLEAQAVANRESSWHMEAGNEHCPGSTSVCRSSCYVSGLESAVPATYALYRHNATMIRRILDMPIEIATEWAQKVADWITENAFGGFRWHVSGDVFSYAYARWIAEVCQRSPNVDHWIYSRSFDANILEPLLDLDNLALNLSADRENYEIARDYMVTQRARGLATPMQICYLSDDGNVPADLEPGSVLFPDYALRGRGATPDEKRAGSAWWQGLTSEQRRMVCPTDFYGKSDANRCGPCTRCLL